VWCPQLDDATKDAIWAHVQRLSQTAKLIEDFDGDMCSIIDQITADLVDDVTDVAQLDTEQMLDKVKDRLLADETLMAKVIDFVASRDRTRS